MVYLADGNVYIEKAAHTGFMCRVRAGGCCGGESGQNTLKLPGAPAGLTANL